MTCRKCQKEIQDDFVYCPWCGAKQEQERTRKKRGNGQGSVYQLQNRKWVAQRVWGYYTDDDGKKHISRTRKSGFSTKKEALAYLATMTQKSTVNTDIPFLELYRLWKPFYAQRGISKSTMDCYHSAMNYFKTVWPMKLNEIGIDDLQECILDCPKGKRTRQNMKVVASLLYKYAIPRGYTQEPINLGEFLYVVGTEGARRQAFTTEEIKIIRNGIGVVPYADYIYCMIYLGFRPNEFLDLTMDSYNCDEKCFIGGSKTEAGKNRIVTISPKIQPIIDRLTDRKTNGHIFCNDSGNRLNEKRFRFLFAEALRQLGIPSTEERKMTPHCCRHTFATLMKGIDADSKDKLELIGHTTEEMLQYYQHVSLDDLRKITDQI